MNCVGRILSAIPGISRRLETSFSTNLFLALGLRLLYAFSGNRLSFCSVGGIPGITQITKAPEDSEMIGWLSQFLRVLEVRENRN